MMRPLATAACAIALSAAGGAGARADVEFAIEQYPSGETHVRIECYAPSLGRKHPALLLLYGSGGLGGATHEVFRGLAMDLCARGYAVYIPYFFDRTRHEPGAPIRQDEQTPFMEAVADAVKFVAGRDEVDPERMGLFGVSMGAGLAFTRGALDKRVKAVVSLSGSLPIGSRAKFPPTLLLHGSKDAGTPVKYVRKFEEQLKAQETPCEVRIYAGVPHNFEVARFPEIGRRAGAFFDKYLKADAAPSAKAGTPRPAAAKKAAKP